MAKYNVQQIKKFLDNYESNSTQTFVEIDPSIKILFTSDDTNEDSWTQLMQTTFENFDHKKAIFTRLKELNKTLNQNINNAFVPISILKKNALKTTNVQPEYTTELALKIPNPECCYACDYDPTTNPSKTRRKFITTSPLRLFLKDIYPCLQFDPELSSTAHYNELYTKHSYMFGIPADIDIGFEYAELEIVDNIVNSLVENFVKYIGIIMSHFTQTKLKQPHLLKSTSHRYIADPKNGLLNQLYISKYSCHYMIKYDGVLMGPDTVNNIFKLCTNIIPNFEQLFAIKNTRLMVHHNNAILKLSEKYLTQSIFDHHIYKPHSSLRFLFSTKINDEKRLLLPSTAALSSNTAIITKNTFKLLKVFLQHSAFLPHINPILLTKEKKIFAYTFLRVEMKNLSSLADQASLKKFQSTFINNVDIRKLQTAKNITRSLIVNTADNNNIANPEDDFHNHPIIKNIQSYYQSLIDRDIKEGLFSESITYRIFLGLVSSRRHFFLLMEAMDKKTGREEGSFDLVSSGITFKNYDNNNVKHQNNDAPIIVTPTLHRPNPQALHPPNSNQIDRLSKIKALYHNNRVSGHSTDIDAIRKIYQEQITNNNSSDIVNTVASMIVDNHNSNTPSQISRNTFQKVKICHIQYNITNKYCFVAERHHSNNRTFITFKMVMLYNIPSLSVEQNNTSSFTINENNIIQYLKIQKCSLQMRCYNSECKKHVFASFKDQSSTSNNHTIDLSIDDLNINKRVLLTIYQWFDFSY